MEIVAAFFKFFKDDPLIAMISISFALNVYLFKLYLQTGVKYENLLKDNIQVTKQVNLILRRFRIKGTDPYMELPPHETKTE